MKACEWAREPADKSPREVALTARWYLIILELPGVCNSRNVFLFCYLMEKLVAIRNEVRDTLIRWINDYSKGRFQRLVFSLRELLTELVCLVL